MNKQQMQLVNRLFKSLQQLINPSDRDKFYDMLCDFVVSEVV